MLRLTLQSYNCNGVTRFPENVMNLTVSNLPAVTDTVVADRFVLLAIRSFMTLFTD